jgi:rubredoxin
MSNNSEVLVEEPMHQHLPDVGTCPVCKGSKRMSVQGIQYATTMPGYKGPGTTAQGQPVPETADCTNCGAQYMFGRPTGLVKHNTDGVPCTHVYDQLSVGHNARCIHLYQCRHCGDFLETDSGD